MPHGSSNGLRALLNSVGSTRRSPLAWKASLCAFSITLHWAIGAEPRKAPHSSLYAKSLGKYQVSPSWYGASSGLTQPHSSLATVSSRGTLSDPQSSLQALDIKSRLLWRPFQVTLAALFPVAVSTEAALVLSRLFHPRRWGTLADALPRFEGETTKVCVQPLSFRPLPIEEDSPHHVSRFVGRLRDWSRCKLLDARRGVNPIPK